MAEDQIPKKPAPQQRVVVPPKQIVHMACRAKGGCGCNQAYISMMIPLGMMQGGGTVYHYRCCGCGGKFVITR
ncbi:MAG: hypothetical protein A2Y38_08035 [Spirochaetes bacterium GWB1_59_5]|nr:MAG: hypothetical protein A2Y38_08035 [Spirochaetes bacterium GWB1_59_5]